MTAGLHLNQSRLTSNTDYLLAFFHAQRTGGSQFKAFLKRMLGAENIHSPQTAKPFIPWNNIRETDLVGISAYASHNNYAAKTFGTRTLLPITIVRDPAIRSFSLYNYCKKKSDHELHDLANSHDLSEFYKRGSARKPAYFQNTQCLRTSGSADFDQTLQTVNNHYFAICTIDNMSKMAEQISGLLGLSAQLPAKRETDQALNGEYITSSFRSLVESENESDASLFDTVSNSEMLGPS